MKKFIATLILFLTFSGVANAATVTVDFEDVDASTDGYTILNDYAGAIWNNFGVLNTVSYDSDYAAAAVSPVQIAYNVDALSPASIVFDSAVDFVQAYFAPSAGALNNPFDTIINWTLGDGSTGTDTITLAFDVTGKPIGQWWKPTGGIQNLSSLTFATNPYDYFGIDNITYSTPVPEPTSVALGLISLVGLFGARKRKQQA